MPTNPAMDRMGSPANPKNRNIAAGDPSVAASSQQAMADQREYEKSQAAATNPYSGTLAVMDKVNSLLPQQYRTPVGAVAQQSSALEQARGARETAAQAAAYLNPDAINTRQQDYSYLGRSADDRRNIERLGSAPTLEDDAFRLQGYNNLQENQFLDRARYLQQAGAVQARAPIQTQGPQAQTRGAYLDMLMNPGQSAAEAQLYAGQEAAARNALAMARSGRGYGGGGGAMRQAQFAAAEGLGQANQQAAVLRAQEEATRRGQLGQLAATDVQTALAQQGQMDQTALAYEGMRQGSYGQAAQLSALQQAAMGQQAQLAAQMQQERDIRNASYANYETPDNTMQNIGAGMQAASAGLGMMTSLAAMSDERSKERIRDLEQENSALREASPMAGQPNQGWRRAQQSGAAARKRKGEGMQDAYAGALAGSRSAGPALAAGTTPAGALAQAAPAKAWQYRPEMLGLPGTRPGQQVGPMTGDLKQNPLTSQLVLRDPTTGMEQIDVPAATTLNLSATGELARRLDEIERTQIAGIQGGR